jgi:hypothetical protein
MISTCLQIEKKYSRHGTLTVQGGGSFSEVIITGLLFGHTSEFPQVTSR